MELMDGQRQFGWSPAGPIAEAYGKSLANGKVAVCVGPTGGGKTTESIRRTIRIAQAQHPSPQDGIRKARIIVLAPTYRKLWDQVVGSYQDEIKWSKSAPGWKGGVGEPCEHIYDFMWKDDYNRDIGQVHVEVLFRAPGEGNLEDFFRGLKATAFWIPEMDTHETVDLLSLASNRTHRYPEMDDRPDDPNLPTAYGGVYGDANAPIVGSWFHKRFFLERKDSDLLFLQPPGYDENSPDGFHALAENKHNLRKADRQFYRTKAGNHEEHDVERLLKNRPGFSRNGKPVYEYFNPITMASPEGFDPDPNLPVVVGLDAGSNTLRHGAVFFQRTYGGQLRALAEYSPEGQSDIVEAAEAIKRLRETRFAACKQVEIVVDPAARGQSAVKRGVTWVDMLRGMTGLDVRPAQTNVPSVRRAAIKDLLKKQAGPGIPAFMISSPHCPRYLAACAGEFRYKKTGDKVSELPEKNTASHVAEGGEYGAMGIMGVGQTDALISDARDRADDGFMAAILPD